MSNAVARAPIAAQTLPAFTSVALHALTPAEILNIRGNADEPRFGEALASALGSPPPVAANTWVVGDGLQLLWAGPDEWLAVVEPNGPVGRLSAVRAALGGQHAAVTSLRAGYAVVELIGERTRDILTRGTPLDLHARRFGAGQCAQTRLGHGTVVLWQVNDAPTFRVMIRRSMAGYLRDWLAAVSRRMDGAAYCASSSGENS